MTRRAFFKFVALAVAALIIPKRAAAFETAYPLATLPLGLPFELTNKET